MPTLSRDTALIQRCKQISIQDMQQVLVGTSLEEDVTKTTSLFGSTGLKQKPVQSEQLATQL